MKILIYTPYLNIAGGGEQYLLNWAQCLPQHQITFVTKSRLDLRKAGQRFQIDTNKFKTIPFLPFRQQQKNYQLILFVSDGSIPFLPFAKSILLFMSPFPQVKKSISNRVKLKYIDHILCFSNYTKNQIDRSLGVSAKMIYPSVNTDSIPVGKKNLIINVGRFSQSLHKKKQDKLIDAFIDLEPDLPDWKLILAGGAHPGDEQFLSQLKTKANGHRISIKTNISASALNQLYAWAKLYWHATGLEEDLGLYPQRAEHFGISIVEAMGHGCVPLVFNAGGPKEIITSQSGKTWDSLDQLKSQTLKLINNPSRFNQLAAGAVKRANYFNKKTFCKKVNELVQK